MRALTLRRREAAEAHAARTRNRYPRNAELITVEEIAAADEQVSTGNSLDVEAHGVSQKEPSPRIIVSCGQQ